jgi:hypothetical protein
MIHQTGFYFVSAAPLPSSVASKAKSPEADKDKKVNLIFFMIIDSILTCQLFN